MGLQLRSHKAPAERAWYLWGAEKEMRRGSPVFESSGAWCRTSTKLGATMPGPCFLAPTGQG